jgi:ABC-type Fe3+-hydroxamate transport system substrate-binding protein
MRKVTLIAIAVLAVASVAFAGQTQIAKGKVQAVSGNTVTVASDDGEVWTFEATAKTTVVAEGAAHRSEALSAVGKRTTLGQFVRENQYVIVNFWEDGDTHYIKKLRVL